MSSETFSSQPRRMAMDSSRFAQGCWLLLSHCNSYIMCFFKKTIKPFPSIGFSPYFIICFQIFFKGCLVKTSDISKAVCPLSLKVGQRKRHSSSTSTLSHVPCAASGMLLSGPFSPGSALFTHPVKSYPANGLFEKLVQSQGNVLFPLDLTLADPYSMNFLTGQCHLSGRF